MNRRTNGTAVINVQIQRVLESAVILSWNDLLRTGDGGVIHVEYATAPEVSLQYLKVWQSLKRGGWSLVCEYWMSRGSGRTSPAGLTFNNGFQSEGLSQMLEIIMQHQRSFVTSAATTCVDLMQVHQPTEKQTSAAAACMKHAYESLGLRFADLPAAAVA